MSTEELTQPEFPVTNDEQPEQEEPKSEPTSEPSENPVKPTSNYIILGLDQAPTPLYPSC